MRPRSVEASLRNLLGTLQPNFSLPFFDNVTHLHIKDPEYVWGDWTGIHLLPRLSHIHFGVYYRGSSRSAQVVSDLLNHCETLQVCVIRHHENQPLLDAFQLLKDDRLVFIFNQNSDHFGWDWGCFLHGIFDTDTWAYAESVVMRQQQTGGRVEARCVYDTDEVERWSRSGDTPF
jgi:hypothetical protein